MVFLVVGPSGAGKDTVIDHVRKHRPDLAIAQRVITRAADAGGEEHESVDHATFEAMEAAGTFALTWRANGRAYGVRSEELAPLAEGRDVLISTSRTILDTVRQRFPRRLILYVTAPVELLTARLALRGRETAFEIEERLRRAELATPTGEDVAVIDNSGAVEAAVEDFLAALDHARNSAALTPSTDSV